MAGSGVAQRRLHRRKSGRGEAKFLSNHVCEPLETWKFYDAKKPPLRAAILWRKPVTILMLGEQTSIGCFLAGPWGQIAKTALELRVRISVLPPCSFAPSGHRVMQQRKRRALYTLELPLYNPDQTSRRQVRLLLGC